MEETDREALIDRARREALGGASLSEPTKPELASRADLLEVGQAILDKLAKQALEINAIKPKEGLETLPFSAEENPDEYNEMLLAANATLILQAAETLSQLEAKYRWFEAALNDKNLRKHLTSEQQSIYRRMLLLLKPLSITNVYEDLVGKLLTAGYQDPEKKLSL